MRIDVLDKKHFLLFEDNLRRVHENIYQEIRDLKSLVMQLQDRIKMLEDKNDREQ